MLLTREIIKQGIKDLHVVCHSHGQGLDLLIGAGCVSYLEIAYGGHGKVRSNLYPLQKSRMRGSDKNRRLFKLPDEPKISGRSHGATVYGHQVRP